MKAPKFISKIRRRLITSLFNIEMKDSRAAPLMIVGGGGGAIWSEKNYYTFSKEAYLKNVISFRCVDLIAKSVSSTPWKIFERTDNGKRSVVQSHPLNDVIRRPNPLESFNQVLLKAIAFLCLAGNSYMEKVGPTTGPNQGMPKELYVLRPDRMLVLQDQVRGIVSGYRFWGLRGPYIDFLRDPINGECDILHLKLFNPLDDFYGGAVSESIGYEIDTYNELTNWNKALLQNMARPGMIFQVNGNLTPEQWTRLENQLNSRQSGGDNAGKNLILEGNEGNKAVPYGWSPKELDYIEGGREMGRRIALGWGVPPMLLGIPGDNTYSNMQEARLAFWEETIFFYLRLMRGELNNWFFGSQEQQLTLDPVLDDVPALSPRRDALWKRAQDSTFIKINEKREMVGKDDLGSEGDVILVSSLSVPLSEEGSTAETGTETEPTGNGKNPSARIKPKPENVDGNGNGKSRQSTQDELKEIKDNFTEKVLSVRNELKRDIDSKDIPQINITNPPIQVDVRIEKGKVKKTINYKDMNGNSKNAEVTEEDV